MLSTSFQNVWSAAKNLICGSEEAAEESVRIESPLSHLYHLSKADELLVKAGHTEGLRGDLSKSVSLRRLAVANPRGFEQLASLLQHSFVQAQHAANKISGQERVVADQVIQRNMDQLNQLSNAAARYQASVKPEVAAKTAPRTLPTVKRDAAALPVKIKGTDGAATFPTDQPSMLLADEPRATVTTPCSQSKFAPRPSADVCNVVERFRARLREKMQTAR